MTKDIIASAQQSIKERHAFHIVLAGGTTPRRLYELLRTQDTHWHAWHVYLGDERCLPAEHEERNSRMVTQTLLDFVNIPAAQIHMIPAELGPTNAAQTYAITLRKIALFDLVLLGLGEDGHTASLFPQQEWGTSPESPATLAILAAPKPPAQRVSMSAFRLSQTRQLFFIVSGTTKKQAVYDWRQAKNVPARAITPNCGVDVYIEQSSL